MARRGNPRARKGFKKIERQKRREERKARKKLNKSQVNDFKKSKY